MQNDLSACQEQLARVSQDFEDFVYIVSHDLKAPIRAISNLSAWIEEDLGTTIAPDIQSNLKLLRNRTDRLEKMLQAILQLSRVARRDLDIKPVNLSLFIPEIAGTFSNNKVTIQVSGQLPVITTYYKKLQQVLEQLFTNAIMFSDKKEVFITVQARENPEFVQIEVHDNGPGIPQNNADKIFGLFFTGRPKDEDEAVGVGLTLAKQTVEFAGGTIELKDWKNGCTFLINWPKKLSKTA